ncbi:Protein JTB [Dirofilaria immitis]
MFESLINRRFLLLGTVVILVTFVFLVCIYQMENVYDGNFVLKKLVKWNIQQNMVNNVSQVTHPISYGTTEKLPDHLCYKNEPFVVLESCIACSQFERDAVKAAYCLETGFYDKVNCTQSKRLGLKPCFNRINRSIQFNLFALSCAFCFVISYGFVNWRQNLLRKQGYLRIQNQCDT